MTKNISDPVQAILAEELAGQTENWSDLAASITTILRARFEITEHTYSIVVEEAGTTAPSPETARAVDDFVRRARRDPVR
ncbi:hypothetical protein GCM10009551_053860 [Nocardiopsis tropica]|uniref:hypothetical protein n=1 Tax=Tsukamurella strandjordii TaxID=147577 RepID=UPI0031D7CB8B